MEEPRNDDGSRIVSVLGWITLAAGIALIVLRLADGRGFSVGGAGAVLLGTLMALTPGQFSSG